MNREIIVNNCHAHLEDRLQSLEHEIRELGAAMASETKSSAGDKYETGREMLSAETDKKKQQYALFLSMKREMQALAIPSSFATIRPGSIFRTEQGWFFISIPLGEVQIENESIFLLSAQAPLAKAAMGKSVDERFVLNGRNFVVLEILSR
jgi:hypothetical protein